MRNNAETPPKNRPPKQAIHACMFNHELLTAYASGNADQQQRVTVERHLAQCSTCRREVTELEHVWWSLETWQEADKAALRLQDLRCRIQKQGARLSLWQQWRAAFKHQAGPIFEALRHKPALVSFGIMVVATLFAVPFAKQMLHPQASISSSNGHSSPMARSETPALTHDQKPVNVQLVSNEIRTPSQSIEHRGMSFDEVVAISKKSETHSRQENRRWFSGYQMLSSVSVGYSPNANVLPANDISENHRPQTYNPVTYYNSYRVKQQ